MKSVVNLDGKSEGDDSESMDIRPTFKISKVKRVKVSETEELKIVR